MTVGYYRLPNQAHEHQNTAKCLIVGKILADITNQDNIQVNDYKRI